jgi:hypothetical protein
VLLLVITIDRSVDAEMPPHFSIAFVLVGAALCFVAWTMRQISPDEYPRDRKTFWEIMLDFVLLIPRMTLAIWGTLRALQFLDDQELSFAMRLLQRIDENNSLPIYSVPLEIPHEGTREKIVLTLQILELVDLRKKDEDLVLTMRDDRARALCQALIRLNLS